METITKILIFSMTLAVVITMINVIYNTSDQDLNVQLQDTVETYDTFTTEYFDQVSQTTPETQSIFLSKEYGDLKTGGKGWFDVLRESVKFADTNVYESYEEQMIHRYLNMLTGLLYTFNAVLIFLILYTKFNG